MHGVTHTLDEIRERGVPGFEVEVVGTDANVDRRLSAVAEVDIPFYAGLKVGVPSLPAIVEALAEGRYDLVHLCTPGPGRRGRRGHRAASWSCRSLGSYHTELAAYAGLRAADPRLEFIARAGASPPSTAQCQRRALARARRPTTSLRGAGDRRRAHRALGPRRRRRALLARHARDARVRRASSASSTPGRLTREKGADLLADAFLAARERDPRLHLVPGRRRPRGGRAARAPGRARDASWAGWRATRWPTPTRAPTSSSSPAAPTPSGRSCSRRRPAACRSSRWPRAARARSSRTASPGCLCPPDAQALADAVVELAAAPLQRERLAQQRACDAVRERTWERALGRLAEGYRRALGERQAAGARRAA